MRGGETEHQGQTGTVTQFKKSRGHCRTVEAERHLSEKKKKKKKKKPPSTA